MIPRKQSYSDREIEEILNSLFEEKKKVRDLKLQLENSKLSPQVATFDEERAALKAEISHLKQKLEERSKQGGAPSTRETQLERVIQFLRGKCDETEAERNTLLKKCTELESAVKQAQPTHDIEALLEEEKALKVQLESLRKIALEATQAKTALENQMREQEGLLGNSCRELEVERQKITASIQELKEQRRKEEEIFQKRIQQLEEELKAEKAGKNDSHHHFEETQRSLEFVKAQLEAKEKEADDTFRKLQEQLLTHQELVQFTEELKQKLVKAEELRKTAQETLSLKENQTESLNAQVANLARSLSDLEEVAEQAQSEKTEQESRLKVAQQHLAKKVRETTILAEKNEELRVRAIELEQALDTAKAKQLELQTALDMESQHQKKLHEQYQENVKALEAQTVRWESRYFEAQKACQDLESKNRELKRLEDRFNKMQQALSHLGAILGSPMSISPQEPELLQETTEAAEVQLIPPAAPCATIQPSLFDTASPSPQKFKDSLFG